MKGGYRNIKEQKAESGGEGLQRGSSELQGWYRYTDMWLYRELAGQVHQPFLNQGHTAQDLAPSLWPGALKEHVPGPS